MNSLFNFDKANKDPFEYLIGTDEAGRGPGAGPVFAAAVCFKTVNEDLINALSKINDSKQLKESVREELFEVIINNSIYSIHQGSIEEIERDNILRTSLNTMNKACCEVIQKLKSENVFVIVDGNKKIINFNYPQQFVIKGDAKSASIAAASILAKVSRDRFMQELHKEYPQYDWAVNKGYMTKKHLEAVDKFGLTKWHRKSFFQKHFEKAEQLSLL